MSDQDQVFWMGKPLKDYSKDELIEIVRTLALRVAEYQAPNMSRAFALGEVEMVKRGEGK